MRVACYCRVSTEDQKRQQEPIDGQLAELRRFAAERNWTVVDEYRDEGLSGRNDRRPAFQRMIADAKQKRFDKVLCWKFDRFARDQYVSVLYKRELRKYGVEVISIKEPVEDNASGRLLEGILESIGGFYSENLAGDVYRGMRSSASKGYVPGGRAPIGYHFQKIKIGDKERTKLVIDPETAPLVQRIFRMAGEGTPLRTITQIINREGIRTRAGVLWTRRAVLDLIKNDCYLGTLNWGRTRRAALRARNNDPVVKCENAHPALVEREEFDRIQEMLKARRFKFQHPRRVASVYLLSGLMRCGKCGSPMIGKRSKGYTYYYCRSKATLGAYACDARSIRKHVLEGAIVDHLRDVILTPENLKGILVETRKELEKSKAETTRRVRDVTARAGRVTKKLRNLLDAVETAGARQPDLVERIAERRAELSELEREKARLLLDQNDLPKIDLKTIKKLTQDFQGLIASGTVEEQKAFLASFVHQITVSPPEVEVTYTMPENLEKDHARVSLPIERRGGPSTAAKRSEAEARSS